MGNTTKKTFLTKASDIYGQGYRNLLARKLQEIDFGVPSGMPYRFFVNKEKKTVAVLSCYGARAVVKPFEGDEFDVYTGVVMALWKILTKVPYYKVRELINAINPNGDSDAETTRLITLMVEGMTGISKENILADYSKACEAQKTNPHFDVNIVLEGTELEKIAKNVFNHLYCEEEDEWA